MKPAPATEEFMRVGAVAAFAVWQDMRRGCPHSAGRKGRFCTHQENPLWTNSCEFDACPFIRRASQGETT